MNKDLIIAGRKINSRLLMGTGKFSSPQIMRQALEASGAEIITVALRRVDLEASSDPIMSYIDREKYIFMPNTSGARDAEEAIRLAKVARAFGFTNWLKLEITPEPNYLLPDPIETLKAAEHLVKIGFIVLPYINADPILAKKLEDVGVATVMPLGAPIGTNKGLRTKEQIQIIIEQARIPVIVDAGIGSPSHAAEALEIGADAVLVNTAIATSENPILSAQAFKLAVEAGRLAYLAQTPTIQSLAEASSPLSGIITRN